MSIWLYLRYPSLEHHFPKCFLTMSFSLDKKREKEKEREKQREKEKEREKGKEKKERQVSLIRGLRRTRCYIFLLKIHDAH